MITMSWFVFGFLILACIQFGFCLGGRMVKREQRRTKLPPSTAL